MTEAAGDTMAAVPEVVDLGALLVQRPESDERTLVQDFCAAVQKRVALRLSDFAGRPLCNRLIATDGASRGTASVVRLSVSGTSEPFYILVTNVLLSRICAAIFNAEDKEIFAAEQPARIDVTPLDRAIAERAISILTDEMAAMLSSTGDFVIKGRDGNISRLPLDFFHLPVTHARVALGHVAVEGGGPELEILCPRPVAASLVETAMKPARRDAAAWRRNLYEAALEIPFHVDANVAQLTMPMSRLTGLSVGSEIPIQSADFANLDIEGTRIAAAEAGDQNGQKAVRILAFETGQNIIPAGK